MYDNDNDKDMKSVQPINMFHFKFNNDKLENDVYKFFNYNGLLPLFDKEEKAGIITINDAEARELTKIVSKKQRILKEFGDFYLTLGQTNKSYNEAVFKIIDESRSLTGMVNKIERYMDYIKSEIHIEHLSNTWNIVFYNKDLK